MAFKQILKPPRVLNKHMAGNSLEHQLRYGKLTHLMERVELNVSNGQDGYACALCELRIVARSLRDARKVAEQTYGKCRAN